MVDMIKGLVECGIPEAHCAELAEKMEAYIKEIILFNSAYNLTNTSDRDELVVRHIFDSLAAFSEITKLCKNLANERSDVSQKVVVADIGSGGGLPGIPLAAAFFVCAQDNKELADVSFELVERMEKRCSFLENCAAILGLKNVTVVNSEAERVPETAYDIVKDKGYLCAYKAKQENIKEEMTAISLLVPTYDVQPLKVPGLEDSERNLVIIRK